MKAVVARRQILLTLLLLHTYVQSVCHSRLWYNLLINMQLVHRPLMGGLLHLVQRGRAWAGPQPAQAPLAVPNVTAHPSTASVRITVWLYNGLFALQF